MASVKIKLTNTSNAPLTLGYSTGEGDNIKHLSVHLGAKCDIETKAPNVQIVERVVAKAIIEHEGNKYFFAKSLVVYNQVGEAL